MSLLNNSNAIPTVGGGYNLTDSLRFRSSASAYLSRTPTVAGNRKTWTLSAWVKRGKLGSSQSLFTAGTSTASASSLFYISLWSTDGIRFSSGTAQLGLTTAIFRDPSAWYHIVAAVDTTQAVADNRIKLYVNGVQIAMTVTSLAQNDDTATNNTVEHNIGKVLSIEYLDAYLTEINLIDGQALTPSDFGEYNEDTGVWQPARYTGTYGTNGFYLKGRGTDNSGNGNNWTENNFNTTTSTATTYDIMTDVPTLTNANTANFATLNPLTSLSGRTSLSAANLQALGTSGVESGVDYGTIGVTSGKWYWENTVIAASGSYPNFGAVRVLYNSSNGKYVGSSETGGTGIFTNGGVYKEGSLLTTVTTYTTSDIIGIALDLDSLTCAIYKNNTLLYTTTGLTAGTYWAGIASYNSSSAAINFGQRPFTYTPPTGYKKLNTFNLPDSSIVDGSENFNTVPYTGDGATSQNITGTGFTPDFVWIKNRTLGDDHVLQDSVRGVGINSTLMSNTTNAEGSSYSTPYGYVSALNTNGFSVAKGTDSTYGNRWVNENSSNYAAWNWKAGGTAVSNTDGTIASSVSANTTAGFSVVTYTGNGTSGATVGHSLGVAPRMVFIKNRDSTTDWQAFGDSLFTRMQLNNSGGDDLNFPCTFSSSTITLPATNPAWSSSGNDYVAYCFADVEGYSKIGSYTGNGLADGSFVYTGFRPAYILMKGTNVTSWVILDNQREGYNVVEPYVLADSPNAESSAYTVADFLSNGFKMRSTGVHNASGQTYIYMAFAENPFKNSLAR